MIYRLLLVPTLLVFAPLSATAPAQDDTEPVRGLRLEPTPDKAPEPRAETLVFRLWVALGAALLAALGALAQWRRGRAPA